MKKNFEIRFRFVILLVIFFGLIFLDYGYHEELARSLMKNYAWLGFYRYGMTSDFMYSFDVILGSIIFLSIAIYGLVKREISNITLVVFPIILIVLHFMTIL